MRKSKQLKNQRRQEKNALRKRQRGKQNLHYKHSAVQETKNVNVRNQASIKQRLKWFIVSAIEKLLCKIGLHKWNLMSGVEGKPKYICRRCYKMSKELW